MLWMYVYATIMDVSFVSFHPGPSNISAAVIEFKALCGGDWSVHGDYWRAVIGAGLLEGEVYAIKSDQGAIMALSVWFQPGNGLFATFVLVTLTVQS